MTVAELQALCDGISGAVLAVDGSGGVIAANRSARERASDFEPNQAVERPARAPEPEAISIESVFDAKLAADVRKAIEVDRRGGSLADAKIDDRIAIVPVSGRSIALVMERPAADAESKAAARDASLDALAMLAHDLRGSLSNVCGAFSLLDEDLAEDRRHGPRVAAMRGALAHFSDLIGAALDVEALSAGRISVKEQDVDLATFAESVKAIWEPKFAEIGADFQVTIMPDAPSEVRADPMRLRQIAFNLLGNSAAHSKADKVRLMVNGFPDQTTGEAMFALGVEDNGVGFQEHVLDKLRGAGSVALYGDGRRRLGLSVIQDVCAAMGGRLRFFNLDDGGAHICAVAPVGNICGRPRLNIAAEQAMTPIAQVERSTGGLEGALDQGGVSGLKALLAEDNTTNQLVATQMLDKLGCAVDVAADGVEAVEMLQAGGYDFLLVDIEMPKMSGIDVLRRLRDGKAGPADLPAIALTAYAMAEHRRKVADAGADGMIAKPILGVKSFEADLVEILGRVRKARGAKHLQPAEARQPTGRPTAVHSLRQPDIDDEVFNSLISVIGEDASDEFLERVETDLADVRLRIRNGARDGDIDEIRAGAHILISVAGAIGARELQKVAQALHAAAAANDLESARAYVKDGDAEFMAVAAFIYRRRAGAPRKDV